MACTRSKYRGLLGKPLNPYQDLDAERAFRARVEALFKWFEIDPTRPDAYERLAIALAFRHVPGFQFPETMEELDKARGLVPGRKTVVPAKLHGLAISLVNESKEELGTVAAACRALTRRGGRFAGIRAKELENFYYRTARKLRGFSLLRGVESKRLCSRYPSSVCFDKETHWDEMLDSCAEGSKCRLYDILKGHSDEFASDLKKFRETISRIAVWRERRRCASATSRIAARTTKKRLS